MLCKYFILLAGLLVFSSVHTNGRLSQKSSPQSEFRVIERVGSYYANDVLLPEIKDIEGERESDRKVSRLGNFIWSSCSSPDSLVKLKKLEVTDPISIPGNVTISFDSIWTANITSPLKVVVSVQRKVAFFWVDVPCISNVGSCTYEDFCAILPYPKDRPCPEPFKSLDLPCNCPGAAGVYVKNNTFVHIPDEHIPEILARGLYNVGAKAWIGDQEVVCLKFSFSLA